MTATQTFIQNHDGTDEYHDIASSFMGSADTAMGGFQTRNVSEGIVLRKLLNNSYCVNEQLKNTQKQVFFNPTNPLK